MRAALLALALAMAATASGQPAPRSATPSASPYDARARELAARAMAGGSSADGVLPLLELWSLSTRVSPGVMAAELDRLAGSRLPEPRLSFARYVRALERNVHGARAEAVRELDTLGFVRAWTVTGPFDNEGEAGFADELDVESARAGHFDASREYDGKRGPVTFRAFPAEAAWSGYVNLGLPIRPAQSVCAVAATTLTVRAARTLRLYAGADGAMKLYFNGEPVHMDGGLREAYFDRSVAVVAARAGANRVLIKICNTTGGLGFLLRVTDDRGRPAADVRADATVMPDVVDAHGGASRALADTDFDVLRRAAEREGSTAAQKTAYARYLVLTGGDDIDERRARDLAAQAFDAEPTAERAELAYALAEERGERMRFVRVARERFPDDPKTRVLDARLALTGPHPVDALRILSGFAPTGVDAIVARRLRAATYAELGLGRSALAEIRAAVELAPESFELRIDLAGALDEVGLVDQAIDARRAASALREADVGLLRMLAEDDVRRGDVASARGRLDAVYRIARFDDAGLAALAEAYLTIDDAARARALLDEAIALSPEEPGLHARLARLHLERGERPAAIVELQRVLELQPQHADARTLLGDLEETHRDDQEYATPIESILARRTDGADYPYTLLHDLTVNTVYENGLSSQFRQIAIQVHDDEGARQFRGYGIAFDPDQQRIEIVAAAVHRGDEVLATIEEFDQPMADPEYRMYFDSLNHVVAFPDLEPGDVLELSYRVDDVAAENMFADYYGDLAILQNVVPSAHVEYVLRTPASRRFYMNAPALAGLTRERTETEGRRVDRYVARDVPALRTEDSMPGVTEVAPYLHVSTYAAWEDVGRWYWGLVRDQLQLDDDLRRTVREVVAGATDVETKVRRIHDWVVDHTRYVALEFGIHGFKPYRVTQIARRGFGDCKDKASLMFAMMREAGVDAHLVLVRTRGNGDIAEMPASLAIFDHAIAYVPALDLYLDGTAEHSGLHELPEGDQGVRVLHVWAEGAELRRTPVDAASRNVREREYRFELAGDGSARIEARETVRGVEAASIRAGYEAVGTREERLRRSLRNLFPGVEVESAEFTGLEDREVAPGIAYVARVPRLAQLDGRALRLAPSVVDELVRSLAPTATRNLPLELGTPITYRERRTFTGAGLRALELPTGGVAESTYGRASVACRQEGADVVCECELRIDVPRVAARDFAAFRTWAEAADRLFRQRIRVEVTP